MAKDLNVYLDGKGRNLMEWIREKGENIYTDIGKRTWRVPPIKFNAQKLVEHKLGNRENGEQLVRIEGPVLAQPAVTDQETNRAENLVCGAFESLSNSIIQRGHGSAMFLISNFEYDNYLNKLSDFVTNSKSGAITITHRSDGAADTEENHASCQASGSLVKLPKDVTKRGELDILVLHQEGGVVLVQTKAVGYNFQERTSQFDRSSSIHTAIEKAGEQLVRDHNVMLYIMDDLGLKPHQLTSVVALPNLSRKVLKAEMSSDLKHKVEHLYHLDLDKNFLFEEDFQPDLDGCYSELENWWQAVLLPMSHGLDLPTMQQIAFRYTQVVLSPQQVELLKHEDQYLYLWGPAGSGKTLLLSLKGRQWLRRGCNVAILNTRLGSRGRTVGQVIEATINKTEGLKKKVMRIDLDLMDNEATLSAVVSEQVKGEKFHFLLDEVAWVEETEKLLRLLKHSYPCSSIWCAGMLIECQPEGFEPGRLEVILRCPPSVQRVLRIVDNRDERCQLYKLDSAKAGLPTDGLRTFFVIHSEHGDPSVQPYDCRICGQKLADILINQLNMTGKKTDQLSSDQETSGIASLKINQSSVSGDVYTDQSEYSLAQKLGSSRGSDSGCDVEFGGRDNIEAADDDAVDSLELDLAQKVKSNDKKCRKKKKKNPNCEELSDFSTENKNNNNNVLTRNSEKEISKKNSDICQTQKSKPRNKKSSKNKKGVNDNSERDLKMGEVRNQNSGEIPMNNNNDITTGSNQADNISCENQNNTVTNSGGSPKKKKNCGGRRCNNNNNMRAETAMDSTNYSQLRFSDAVLPVTVPRGWHHYNSRGYWSISREALAQEMVMLGSSPMCEELYNRGVPLKVEEAMVMKAEVENNFVMCPVGAVHGLEYKLVVCVPSARYLPEYLEISQGIRDGTMEPMVLMKRTHFGTDYMKRLDQITEEDHWLYQMYNNGNKIDKIRISTHVAEEGAPYDILYEPLSEEEATLIHQNNLVQSDRTGAASPYQAPTKSPASPYQAPMISETEIQQIKNELCGQCSFKDKCVCQYFKKEELAAVHRLDSWNKAYVLMCASRCTSSLVLVLP